ncbi:SdpI family protein [Methanoregula formicica]|uniref:Putative integral membrane protein n=1 Tax=Methanoregula formicica (strain DSM 22288 / NBRC 105244 / SMSP) TaxID=593750 RepID=L0HEV5_METFS|nr:SdpI family protein [Methanoregula formicica]AGB01629.1 putative integral membrane protein [Methanoregula formicica SMSP]
MVQVFFRIWDAMGWCPMHPTPRDLPPAPEGSGLKTRVAGDSGAVARRSARFMRLAWGVVILAWVLAFLALPHLPEVIPVHWGLHGEPDGFADRLPGALGLPFLTTFIMALLLVIPRFDSVQISLIPFRDSYSLVILATVSMLLCVEVMALLIGLGVNVPLVTLVPVLIGLLFIVMGSLMPHIGRNTTIGIRLPWTLASEEVWKKTHEYGGRLFVAAGVVVVIGSLVTGIWATALMLIVILGTTLYICIWSYRLAKTVPARD